MTTTVSDVQVRITAVDEVTPVLRALSRRLFWFRYGPSIAMALLTAAALIVGFASGLAVR